MLNQTNFQNANLSFANFRAASHGSSAHLQSAILQGAIMPDGKVFGKMKGWKKRHSVVNVLNDFKGLPYTAKSMTMT
ncbi:pentapeptide repeat-containing protein [Coleofasciculus sp. G2-EDA-02]|uniref:pentapeptide repeat-containing protein n=1 Tax=Coleofasciculus sp. G2-EDA-02 TaxID=3069529 RepID=UPI004062F130